MNYYKVQVLFTTHNGITVSKVYVLGWKKVND